MNTHIWKVVSLSFFIIFLSTPSLKAQKTIKNKTEFSKKTNFSFTDEWQFLSTDIYLFNKTKFGNLINKLGVEPEIKRKKIVREQVELITITAKVVNAQYFDGRDVIYPLYNFRVNYDPKSKYKTNISDDIEVIRILDNLPLNSSKEFVDAIIEGETITASQSGEILSMISKQLINLSKVTNPSAAVLTIVGELGNYLESSSRKKSYRFSSTIRLYDDTKFNKKLHSINIYTLKPSNLLEIDDFNTEKISAFIDSLKFEQNVEISRNMLSKLIDYKRFPYLVVVNYKSKYIPQAVVEDKINYSYIEEYSQRIYKACKAGINTDLVCNQEEELIEFMKIFAEFKLQKENYELNNKNNITDEINKNVFIILRLYVKLLNTYENRKHEFKNIPVFENDFKPTYESIIFTAESYLHSSEKLTNIKELIKTQVDLRHKNISKLKEKEAEKYLSILYSIKLPDVQGNTDEYKEIVKLIKKIELNLYQNFYQQKNDKLSKLQADSSNYQYFNSVRIKINESKCTYCKDKLNTTLEKYKKEYDKYLYKIEYNSIINLQNEKQILLLSFLAKKNCIENNKENIENEREFKEDEKYIIEKLEKLYIKINELKQLSDKDISNLSKKQLADYRYAIEIKTSEISKQLETYCKAFPEICKCKE